MLNALYTGKGGFSGLVRLCGLRYSSNYCSTEPDISNCTNQFYWGASYLLGNEPTNVSMLVEIKNKVYTAFDF